MKRKNNPAGFRKRRAANAPDHDPRSGVLRTIRNLVQRGNFSQALAQIDGKLVANPEPADQSKLLVLAGDCLFKQGKFAEAAVAYGKISEMVQNQPTDWLAPALAQIRSFLKAAQVNQAATLANAAVQTAIAYQQQYQTLLSQADANLNASGQVTIPALPPHPAGVASRLGKLFLAEGEVDIAKTFLQQAIQLSPKTCQARIGLAEIALRENNAAEAASLAKEAITLGEYQGKTLSAWNVLLAASRKSGTPIDADLISGLASALPSVRARAVLLIARGLRSQNDGSWQPLASHWLQQEGSDNPRIAAELKKLIFATERHSATAPLSDQLQAAKNLLNTSGISPMEWLSATKQTLSAALLLSQRADVQALIAEGVKRYGGQFQAAFTQSLAMSCKRGNRVDLAWKFLQQNLAMATGDAWRKTLWALAKLQSDQGDHAAAASSYWTYAQNNSQPQRFRAFALMRYALELFRAQQPQLIEQAAPQVQAALAQIQDYEVLLDVARQLRFSRFQQGKALAEDAYQRGKRLALQAFTAAGHPSPAATILFKLSRRAFDFYRLDDIIATWTRLDEAKRQWLWSTNSDYWNWQELVQRAYLASGQLDQADSFGSTLLNDPATPPEAIAILGATYLTLKQKQNDFSGLFCICERMEQAAPSNERTAIAYYWLALRARKRGDAAQTGDFAQRMLLALGKDCALFWKSNYQASAYCLKAGLDLSQIPPHCPVPQEKLQKRLQDIQDDLAILPNSV